MQTEEKSKLKNSKIKKTVHNKNLDKMLPFGNTALIPGVVRIRDAPFYLGMNKNIFRKEVSPFLTKFPIGGVGIGIDRMELDLWIAYVKATKGSRKKIPPWENTHPLTQLKAETWLDSFIVNDSYIKKDPDDHLDRFKKLVKKALVKKKNMNHKNS
jgi:hypothetical protein